MDKKSLEFTYNGISDLFMEIYEQNVAEFDVEFHPLTLEQFQLLSVVGLEYCYYIKDIQATKQKTYISFESDEFFDWYEYEFEENEDFFGEDT